MSMRFESFRLVNGCAQLRWQGEDLAWLREVRGPGADLSDLPLDVVAEISIVWTPEFVAQWQAVNLASPPSLDEVKASKAEAVNMRREQVFAAGFQIPSGPAAGQHMQLRNADDKANWLIAERGAKKAVEAGAGDAPIVPLRSTENITTLITPNAMLELLDGLDAWGREVTAFSWGLKDQIVTAVDQSAIDAIDIDASWPE